MKSSVDCMWLEKGRHSRTEPWGTLEFGEKRKNQQRRLRNGWWERRKTRKMWNPECQGFPSWRREWSTTPQSAKMPRCWLRVGQQCGGHWWPWKEWFWKNGEDKGLTGLCIRKKWKRELGGRNFQKFSVKKTEKWSSRWIGRGIEAFSR